MVFLMPHYPRFSTVLLLIQLSIHHFKKMISLFQIFFINFEIGYTGQMPWLESETRGQNGQKCLLIFKETCSKIKMIILFSSLISTSYFTIKIIINMDNKVSSLAF